MTPFQRGNFFKTIHFYSGLILVLFTGFHLVNHLAAVQGFNRHIEIMDFLRLFYRSFLGEGILLLAVGTQIISGFRLLLQRESASNSLWQRLQRLTGLYLGFFLLVHVSAVMVGRFVLRTDTNLHFARAGLVDEIQRWFFIPYYGLAIVSFFAHLTAILSLRRAQSVCGFSLKAQKIAILLVGVIVAATILFAMCFPGGLS